VFAIAAIGLNHGGDVARAISLVDAAAWAGARAVSIQALDAARLVAPSSPAPRHVVASSLREFLSGLELDVAATRAVVARARSHGLVVVSTPLSEEGVEMLESCDVDAYAITSGDLTYDGLITEAARMGKPVVITTGMGTLEESVRAVNVARRAGAERIAVLHCVSAYPAPVNHENLGAIVTLQSALDVPVGLSDHGTGGVCSAVAAVALGACIYERHLMVGDDAIDRAVSSTPGEFRAIVESMRQTRLALGDGRKRCGPAEAPNKPLSRRGLYARRALRAGERLSALDLIALRPETVLGPADLSRLVHSTLARDLAAGMPITLDHLAVPPESLVGWAGAVTREPRRHDVGAEKCSVDRAS
jgi:sialic acid synthase SpsE